ncbi:hypothetical protein Kpho01_55510 [Kitasatospora phosalacinea]|uniref:Uncharacterized protein n=1 Tax=Kitasatospora phosalacinea TaxID=2065 RepID=A0A9W6USF7_9ACTN|nr:hypothetical protein Kpho01_55510 [Kitasatospora phosalacinea]
MAAEAREVAAGRMEPGEAFLAELFPEALLTATDAVLQGFETDVRGLAGASDEQVMAVVERVVLALNAVNESFDGAAYETGEREQLCEYLDRVLVDGGVDVPALAGRLGIDRYEITDEWRDW